MSVRAKVFGVLFGGIHPADYLVSAFVLILVLLNVTLLILSSEAPIAQANATLFFVLETVSVGIFSIEYLLRLWCCIEKRPYARLGSVVGRLRFMVSFAAVVDLVSVLPFFVFLVVNATAAAGSAQSLQFFSAVRVLRIFRLLKLDRLTRAFKILKNAIFRTSEILFVTLLMELVLFLFVSTVLWVLEPKLYPSIPAAMFVGLLMLTGSDYPPEGEMQTGTKVFVAVTVFISILVFALPTGALASGFDQVSANYLASKKKKKDRGEMPNIAVEDSDEELLKEEENDAPAASSPALVGSLNGGLCPTCGK